MAIYQVYRILKDSTDVPLLSKEKGIHQEDLFEIVDTSSNQRFDLSIAGSINKYAWHVRDVHQLSSDEGSIIVFTFARSLLERKTRVVTDETVITDVLQHEKAPATTVMAIISQDREMLLIERKGFVNESKVWTKCLASILTSSASSLGYLQKIKFEPILKEVTKQEDLRTVQQIKLVLVLPNPDHSERFKELEEQMIRSRLSRLEIKMTSHHEDGIALNNPEGMAAQSLSMAESGYREGAIEMEGINEAGDKEKTEVKNEPLEVVLPPTESIQKEAVQTSISPESKVKLFITKIRSVLERRVPVTQKRSND